MSNDYTLISLEDMNSKFDILIEAVAPIRQMQRDLFATKEGVAELKSDVRVIKAATTDLSRQVADHDRRLASKN